MLKHLSLFPLSAQDVEGRLTLGSCDAVKLAQRFGTPLYVLDEETIRGNARQFRREFGERYPDTSIIYACKAFIHPWVACVLAEEGLGMDAVSAGELFILRRAGFPADKVYLHGNCKTREDICFALDMGVGRIVVDNLDELELLERMVEGKGKKIKILLRLNPGIDPHTHKFLTTGRVDSKFGFPEEKAEAALREAMKAKNLELTGLHFHLGSSIFEVEPYIQAVKSVLTFAHRMRKAYGFILQELDIGGGFAQAYTLDSPSPPLSYYAEAITAHLKQGIEDLSLSSPLLVVEPGRSIISRAGVALYRVGGRKETASGRRYILVDGGMGDNIRPLVYGSKYEAVVASKLREEAAKKVSIGGKFCEGGDIIASDIFLPEVELGDVIAIPGCGAYCLPLQSNYNASLRPAIARVKNGEAHLIREREKYEDLIRHDICGSLEDIPG